MNALPLHTVTAGDANLPPIDLRHGFSMSHAIFTLLMEHLSDHFHLVTPDPRGHGLSPKPVDGYGRSADWADDIAAPEVSAANSIATHVSNADTGHRPFLEKPNRFADDLATFAQGAHS